MNKRVKSKFLRAAAAVVTLLGALSAAQAPAGAQSRRGGGGLLAQAERYSGDQFRFETATPRGARVVSVNRPSGAMLQAIDRGLSELFAVARRRGYRARLSHSEYTIFVARADRTRNDEGHYSPDIALGAAQYRGSVYDRGGYVYAAGMVLSMEPGAFLIAEHDRDFQRVADVARYEGEHIILYHNDRRLYSKTADHSRGGGHPVLQ
ncbi:MAG TPA: hypothetical protein VD968_15695 [Pyrinomonadaceae bacterium]|nr:hypothetical protein [Pyrinomonadaceae bacterium]